MTSPYFWGHCGVFRKRRKSATLNVYLCHVAPLLSCARYHISILSARSRYNGPSGIPWIVRQVQLRHATGTQNKTASATITTDRVPVLYNPAQICVTCRAFFTRRATAGMLHSCVMPATLHLLVGSGFCILWLSNENAVTICVKYWFLT